MSDKQEMLARAEAYFMLAAAYSRAHDDLAEKALNTYGEHGPLVSGVVRQHFPQPIKEVLRDLANMISHWYAKGYACRPKYVRQDTMRALARHVSRRDGIGFYGVRP